MSAISSANDSSSSSTSLRCCSSSDSFTMALLVFLYFHIRQARKQNQRQTSAENSLLVELLKISRTCLHEVPQKLVEAAPACSLRLAHTKPPAPRAAYQTPAGTGYRRHRLARQLHHHCRRARVNDCQPLQEVSYPTTGRSQ